MLIDVTQTLKGYDGEPIMNGMPLQPLTLREAAFTALNSVPEGENPPATIKEKIYALTLKLYSDAAIDLTIDEAAFLKERSGAVMAPLVHGRIVEILENANQLTAIEP